MYIDYSWQFDHRGRTAETTWLDHIRDMVEQVLFTSPGERVNRPDFGSGLLQLVYETNSLELADTVQALARSSLERWLGDLIEVTNLIVTSLDASLIVDLTYTVRRTGEQETAQLSISTENAVSPATARCHSSSRMRSR